MSHDVVRSTLGEQLDKILEYGKKQGTFSLMLVLDEAGDYSAMFNFGSEADDSPMVGGSSLAHATNPVELLGQIVRECRL